MNLKEQQPTIDETKTWLKTVIIHYNFCPFAKPVFESSSISYHVDQTLDLADQLMVLIEQCQHLDNHPDIQTLLIIYPQAYKDFDEYLDYLAISEDLLVAEGYEGVYQLASFHPAYCFESADTEDPANYTNRSPYPMLHLLREASIEQALETFSQPQNIPQRNITTTRQLGLEKMQALLEACYYNQ